MKTLLMCLSASFLLTGCFTMNTHPDFKSQTDDGQFKAFIVSKDTRCLDCHSENQLLDYGFLTAEKSAELDSIIYQYPYWAGNEEVDTITMNEYYLLHPPTVHIIVETPKPVYEPCIDCGEPIPVPHPPPPHPKPPGPVIKPKPDLPKKTRNPDPGSTSEITNTRNNSGGRGSSNNSRQSNENDERGHRTSRAGR